VDAAYTSGGEDPDAQPIGENQGPGYGGGTHLAGGEDPRKVSGTNLAHLGCLAKLIELRGGAAHVDLSAIEPGESWNGTCEAYLGLHLLGCFVVERRWQTLAPDGTLESHDRLSCAESVGYLFGEF